MSKFVPTVVFDFDGVVSEYKRGWEGAATINDMPTPGIKDAIREVREAGYRVVIVSTRCATPEGAAAVEDFLEKHEIVVDGVESLKPPALCYVDDRAICFEGDVAGLPEKIFNFKSWTERERN